MAVSMTGGPFSGVLVQEVQVELPRFLSLENT